MTFLTPWAALAGLLATAGLAALAGAERRGARLCRALGLPPRGLGAPLARGAGIVCVGGLLAVAAAQPVSARVRPAYGRTDAEALFVFDVSRSMAARSRPGEPTRLERARVLARELRAAIPDVPAGVATLTDRVLPNLFPTLDRSAFDATVGEAVGIERPPPDRLGHGRATALAALGDLARRNFFDPAARHRIAVVLTDGETLPLDVRLLRDRLAAGGVTPLFVRVWGADERVLMQGGKDTGYRPDPTSGPALAEIAASVGGRLVGEHDAGGAIAFARSTLGHGPTGPQGRELRARPLAPFAVLAAAVPLLFLLWRRNLSAVPA